MHYNRENEERLTRIAEEDRIYTLWKHSFMECETAFREYVDAQPREVRQILWGYAEAGRMMQQRKVNLACSNMVFPDNA